MIQPSDWLSLNEGRLSVDVVETHDEIVVRSAIAGVRAEDLEINLSEDTLTVRGKREHGCEEEIQGDIHVQECHWGAFSRTIILPTRIDPASVDAVLKRGILTITMKKTEIDRTVPIHELPDL
jgi:HSP20 family protein